MDFFKKKTANKDKEAGTLRLFFFSNNPTAVNEMIRYAPLLPKHYMKLIGTASDAHRAIRNVNRLKPNVFIVDIDTEPDAVDCFMMLEERKYNTYIFVTTKIQDDAHKKVLLNAGADYVHKKDKNFTLWDVVPTLKMLGYFQFPRGFDQQIAVEYKDGDDREYSATKIKPSPLYRELYDDAAVIEEECPGVQYLCIERRGGRPTEYYIVEKNSPVISGEAKRYGKPFSDRPDLLMYVMDDVADGKAIIEWWHRTGFENISQSWLDNGYEIRNLHIDRKKVVFHRVSMNTSSVAIPDVLITERIPDKAKYELENYFAYIIKKYGL